jgi:hypothetical protein
VQVEHWSVGADCSDDHPVWASAGRGVDDLVGDLVVVELGADPLLAIGQVCSGWVHGRERDELGREAYQLVSSGLDHCSQVGIGAGSFVGVVPSIL